MATTEQPPPKAADKQASKAPPLSAEDAEIARQLDLLEKLEVLKYYELFEPEPDEAHHK